MKVKYKVEMTAINLTFEVTLQVVFLVFPGVLRIRKKSIYQFFKSLLQCFLFHSIHRCLIENIKNLNGKRDNIDKETVNHVMVQFMGSISFSLLVILTSGEFFSLFY